MKPKMNKIKENKSKKNRGDHINITRKNNKKFCANMKKCFFFL